MMNGKIRLLILLMLVLNTKYLKAQKVNLQIFDTVSVDVENQVSVAFIGTFYRVLGPCEPFQTGKTRRRDIYTFKVNNDLIGNIKVDEIEITPFVALDSLSKLPVNLSLIEGRQYRVLLNPEAEKLKFITEGNIKFDYHIHLIVKEEIVAITEID